MEISIKDAISTMMTTDVECAAPDQPLSDIKLIYERKDFHHHIPVVENEKLTGIISLSDFMRAVGSATLNDASPVYNEKNVADIMTEHPVTMPVDASIEDVAWELAKGEVHAVVITQNDEVKGIVSTSDIIKFFLSTCK